MFDFSIIIVAYRSAADLAQLIPTVERAAQPCSWRVTIVNNAPADENVAAVLGALDDRVSIVDSPMNLGYSGGLNLGLAHAPPARHIIFLNPDLTLETAALLALGRELDSGAAAAVPLILNAEGTRELSLRREPALLSALGDALFGGAFATRPRWLSEIVREAAAYERPHDVDWSTGAVLAVRADVVAKVGEWDAARFFLYSEETDYARRIRSHGGRIRFVPEAVARHRGAGSGTSPQLEALLEVNKLRYFRKWHPDFEAGLFALIRLFHNAIRPHRPGARASVSALLSSSAREKLPGGGKTTSV